jgi:O-antigen/teichoic acid export membrane protein
MLVMLVIGLFTYRVILKSLGVTDYGVYSAVGGVVTMFMLVMNTVSGAISRYITVGLGKGDQEHLKDVFGNCLTIMAGFCLVIVVLTETAGLWYLNNKMVLPPDRIHAARIVLHTSLLVLITNLMCVPYTAVITAHEHMDAYAYISVLEAVLKLAVAFAVWLSAGDRLVVYAWMLFIVAILVRSAYTWYSIKHFDEALTGFRYKGSLIKEMGAFAGWNFIGSGTYMINTQGVNQLMNHFFGVGMNAARGVADKVEQIVRQFATNIALALNPQLTKSYVGGNKDYAFELVCKGSKYYFWVLFVIMVPFITDSETILRLWVGEVPPEAALFTKLTLVCFLVDYTPNTLITLAQANGRVKRFYLLSSSVAILVFPLAWILYANGAAAWTAYALFIGFYLLKAAVMLRVVHKDTGLSVKKYLREGILPALVPMLIVLPVVCCIAGLIAPAWWRFLLIAALGLVLTAIAIWNYGLTPGEKAFVRSKIGRK